MKVTVDFDLCEANGVCAGLAPKVFELDDDEQLTVLQPEPPEELQARVRKAVERCPKSALSLEE